MTLESCGLGWTTENMRISAKGEVRFSVVMQCGISIDN